MQRRSAPASASASTRRPPTNPVAPVTKARTPPVRGEPSFGSCHPSASAPPSPVALMVASIALLAGCGGCGGEKQSGSSAKPAADQPVQAARGVRLKKVGEFSSPIYVTAPPADKHRLFVV